MVTRSRGDCNALNPGADSLIVKLLGPLIGEGLVHVLQFRELLHIVVGPVKLDTEGERTEHGTLVHDKGHVRCCARSELRRGGLGSATMSDVKVGYVLVDSSLEPKHQHPVLVIMSCASVHPKQTAEDDTRDTGRTDIENTKLGVTIDIRTCSIL